MKCASVTSKGVIAQKCAIRALAERTPGNRAENKIEGGGIPVRRDGKSLEEHENKWDIWRSVGPRRRRRVDERLTVKEIQVSVGVLSVTNLQAVWPVVDVEVRGARHGGQAVGPNGGRSARMSRTRRSSIRNVTTRGTIT
jgi:hypothetical protein